MEENAGYCEGDTCNRRGCKGTIAVHKVENCSCHICPPCSACTSPRGYCPVCGWEETDDQTFNDFKVNVKPDGTWRTWAPRPLDPTKIDWHSLPHTHFTMIKRGVYPEGTTIDEVREKVKGTFGGRFNYFGEGKFEYVAHTD